MSDDTDLAALAKLPEAVQQARAVSSRLRRREVVRRMAPLRLIVAGPMSSGKTTLVHAITGHGWQELGHRVDGPTEVVTEYWPGPRARLSYGRNHRRIELPSTLMDRWGLIVVDTRGVDASVGADAELHELTAASESCAVLYVVPDRGVVEADMWVLDALRAVPTLVVQNLREFEVGVDYPAIQPMSTPDLTGEVALPLALGRLTEGSPEWDGLAEAIALLRQYATPFEKLAAVQRSADDYQQQLRQQYADRLRDLVGRRHVTTTLDGLRLAAELLGVERNGRELIELDRSLAEITRLVVATPSAEEARHRNAQRANEHISRYNVESVTRTSQRTFYEEPPTTNEAQATPAHVGATLQKHGESLCTFIATIVSDGILGTTEAELDRLSELADDVQARRFEIVVVGQFSAGKSSLFNALLGVEPGQELLPTNQRVTTTTLNHIVHGDEESARAEWAEQLQLSLIHSDTDFGNEPCYRVHGEEFAAFLAWLESGEVKLSDCDLLLSSGRWAPGDQVEQSLWMLADAAKIGSTAPADFLYHADRLGLSKGRALPDGEVPFEVDIHRFAKPPRTMPRSNKLRDTIDVISESPTIALRAERLLITHPNELLRYVTLVDTPGTDAPRPGHKRRTRSAVVGDKKRAVVYCFASDKPGSLEDKENIEFLQSCKIGSDELSRFFFVITKKGLNPNPQAQEEIRGRVRKMLFEAGLKPEAIYFTEVVSERNSEYTELAARLSAFGANSQRPLLIGYTEAVAGIVTDVGTRHQETIRIARQGEQQRLARLEALRTERSQMEAVVSAFRDSSEWGMSYVHRSGHLDQCTEVKDVEDEMNRLTDRDSFATIDELISLVGHANDALEKTIRRSWDACMSKLTSEIGRCGNRKIDLVGIDLPGEILPESSVREAIEKVSWRSVWQRMRDRVKDVIGSDGKKWDADVEANRSRITRAWADTRKDAIRAIDLSTEEAQRRVENELRRVSASIDAQIEIASTPPDGATVSRAEKGDVRVSQWLLKLNSLTENIQVA